jgi:hypothetical protein
MNWLAERPYFGIVGVLLLAAALRLQSIDQPFVDEFAWREGGYGVRSPMATRTATGIFSCPRCAGVVRDRTTSGSSFRP